MRFLAPIIAAGLALAAPSAEAQTVWNLVTSYRDDNFHTQNIARFAEDVEEMTGGELRIVVHSNASLLKKPKILRGIQTGQVQAGEILLSAYGPEDPFFEVDSIPFISRGQVTAWQVYELTLPYIREKLAERGLMPLFSVPWQGQGLYARKPINSTSDFEGVKFRTYNALTARMAELMGAIPITVQSAEVPQAFATGVVSAMVTSATTGNDTKAWDFTTHFYDVNAMNTKNMVIVNVDAFEALSEESQAAVLAAAAKAETRGWITSNALQAGMTANLAAHGMTIATPGPELLAELRAIGRQMVDEWLEKAGERGAEFIAAYEAQGGWYR